MKLKNLNLKILLFPIAGSFLYALAFPSILTSYSLNHFTFAILGLSVLFYPFTFHETKITKVEISSILLFIFSIGLLGFYWIGGTIQEFGGIIPPFNSILFLLSNLAISPHFIVFLFIYHIFKKYMNRWPFFSDHSIFFISLIFTLCEKYTPQEFPAAIGHPFISLAPHLGLAPIFGTIIYSFFTILMALTLTQFYQKRKISFFNIFFFILFITLNFVIPLPSQKASPLKDLNIRVVQADIGNYLKYSSEKGDFNSIKEVTERYKETTLQNLNQKKWDLIIWPETAYPFYISGNSISRINHRTLFSILDEIKTPLFFGGYAYREGFYPFLGEDQFETAYNTAFMIAPDGSIIQKYYKHKLLAFGETLPFGFLTPYLAKVVTNISYFASGDEFTLFKLGEIPFISIICYELLLPDFVRTFLESVKEEPQFMINLTNDSWFGNTMEPYQHLFLGKWRAVEFQIPIIRSTNTGVTSVLYPDGSESQQLAISKTTTLDETLKLKLRAKTLYQRWGIIPFFLFIVIFFLLEFIVTRRKG